MPDRQLDKFGQFITEHLHDSTIDFIDDTIRGRGKAPALQSLQAQVVEQPAEVQALIRQCIFQAIRHGMHDFLFALEEASEQETGIAVHVDGENIAELSDGLQGEAFTDDGWIARFSKYATD